MATSNHIQTIETAEERHWRYALWAVSAVTMLRLAWLFADRLDLYPDEAQYWLWAQAPSIGYYSKPPLVAWLIATTTAFLGNAEAGVRFSAPLLHLGAAFFIYGIAKRLYDSRVAAWSAVVYATLPGISASSIIISTDAPLLFFWAAALYGFLRAREPGGVRWWIGVGIAAGLGLLSKYAMAYWLVSALVYLLIVRDERKHLPGFLVASLISLLVYLPNFVWNWLNGFQSYKHTGDNADIGNAGIHPGAFLEFGGSQFGVFGPILFAALIFFALTQGRRLLRPPASLLAWFALPTLVMMLGLSMATRAHPNWSAPTYVSGTILVVALLLERGWGRLVSISVAIHIVAVVALLGAKDISAAIGMEIPGKYDPLHRLRGWKTIGRVVTQTLARTPNATLLCDDREDLASLLYYVQPPVAGKWNAVGGIHDWFDATRDISQDIGADFLLVSRRKQLGVVADYFNEIGPIQHITVPVGRGEQRDYLMVELKGFKGYRLPPAAK